MSTLPEQLYHGSHFKNPDLRPGIYYTKKLVQWDKTESNESLYAIESRDAAILLGFGSAIEKEFTLQHFHYDISKKRIAVTLVETGVTDAKLLALAVYLYEITPTANDQWVKNDNAHNKLDTEWKTKSTITYDSVEKIDLTTYLADFTIVFYHRKQAVAQEALMVRDLPAPFYLKW